MALELNELELDLERTLGWVYSGAGGPSLIMLFAGISVVEPLMLWERGMWDSRRLDDLGLGSSEPKLAELSLAELIIGLPAFMVLSSNWNWFLAGDLAVMGL